MKTLEIISTIICLAGGAAFLVWTFWPEIQETPECDCGCDHEEEDCTECSRHPDEGTSEEPDRTSCPSTVLPPTKEQ